MHVTRRLLTVLLLVSAFSGLMGCTRVVQVSQGGTGVTTAAEAAAAIGPTTVTVNSTGTDACNTWVRYDPTGGYTGTCPRTRPGVRSAGNTTTSVDTLTLDGPGAELIDGGATFAVTGARSALCVRGNGTSWDVY